MPVKKPPGHQDPGEFSEHTPQRSKWSSFAGKNAIAVDKIARVSKPQPMSNLSVASLSSAALARRKSSAIKTDDQLADFQRHGTWDAARILQAFTEAAAGVPRKASRHQKADPDGLTSAVHAVIAAAIYGEVQGIRLLATALARCGRLDTDRRRQADGVARAVGSRNLGLNHLLSLASLASASTPTEAPLLERIGHLPRLVGSLRLIGKRGQDVVSPKQILDVRSQEACLVVVDLSAREPTGGGRQRLPQFTRVVALIRNLKDDLVLLDPAGLYDPVKGADDPTTRSVTLRKPDVLALADFLVGRSPAGPTSPITRLACNAYLSAAPPKPQLTMEITVPGASTFRYC